MLITRIPIKYLLPIMLLLFSLSATISIYWLNNIALANNVEKRILKEAQNRLNGIQGTLEILMQLNQHDSISHQLSAFSALPDNITLLISAANGTIIASNRQIDIGRLFKDSHTEINSELVAKVIKNRNIATEIAADGSWVDAYTSICTRILGALRRNSCGLLYHRIDLAYHKKIAQQPLIVQTRNIAIALSLASLLLGVLIHLLLFRRTKKLSTAVNRFANGEHATRSQISGDDEIAHLAFNIDVMMALIEHDERELKAKENYLKTLFDSVRDPIVVTSINGEILSFNRASQMLFGYKSRDVQGKNINILLPERDRPAHLGYIENYQTGVKSSTVLGKGRELTATNCEGKEFPVEVTITEMHSEQEVKLIGVIRDISERKFAEEQQLLARQVFEATSEAIIITDQNAVIIDVNPAYEEITGYCREEIIGQKPSHVSSNRHDGRFYKNMWKRIRETGNWVGEIWDRRKNGEAFPKWLTINAIQNNHGHISHYVGIFSDITEQKSLEQQLEQLAYYDPLTKLPNRALYRERLEREILQIKRSGHTSALLFIDLDKFKQVNDSLGHDVGDDLLIAVTERAKKCVRKSDTVCRLGGDEFTVILVDIDDANSAGRISQSIIEQLQKTFTLHGHKVQIGGSIGIALIPKDGENYIEINKKADIAMYHAKASGRGNFKFYSDELT